MKPRPCLSYACLCMSLAGLSFLLLSDVSFRDSSPTTENQSGTHLSSSASNAKPLVVTKSSAPISLIPTMILPLQIIMSVRARFSDSPSLDPTEQQNKQHQVYGKLVEVGIGLHVIKSITVPSFFLFTLDPRMEGEGGLSFELHKSGTFEADLVAKISEDIKDGCKNNGLFIDVGTNIGFYTNLAASLGCKVIGFEANSDLRVLVQNSAALNGFDDKIDIVPFGAGPRRETHYMNNKNTCPACSSMTSKDDPLAVEVDVVDISSYINTDPVFMKIDIDGFEVGALEGALQFMRERHLPRGYVEFNPYWWHRGSGVSLERGVKVVQAMSDLGYSFSRLDGSPYPVQEIISGIRSSKPDVQQYIDSNLYFSKEL